jgi:hypothetical protein
VRAHERTCTKHEAAVLQNLPSLTPCMGAIIGPQCDNEREGTLGGYVSIDGPSRGRYALTNHHVVFSPSMPSPTEHGSQFKHDNADFAVDLPTAKTISNTIRNRNPNLKAMREMIEWLHEKKNRATSGTATFSSASRKRLEELDIVFRITQSEVETLEGFESTSGVVAFSSGKRNIEHRTIGPFLMDWALIAPNGEPFCDLEVDTVNRVR